MQVENLISENVKRAVKETFDLDVENVLIEHPINEKWGDYSTNVALEISKKVKQNPLEIAKKLGYKLDELSMEFDDNGLSTKIFEKIEAVSPGFINFRLSMEWLYYVLFSINERKTSYGMSRIGEGKRVLVEFSNPNPNKPLHIGHARNNFLGSSISNILAFLGYEVIRTNYANDWGTHICKSMLMYQKYGNNQGPDKKPDHFVGEFYALYEKKEVENPELSKELAEMFRKLEAGDSETLELWKKITSWAYEGWRETYKEENVTFDHWMYQHNYKDSGKEVVKIALEKGIAEKDETGAIIARLEKYGIPDKVLLRSDGTSVYSTQDLQLAKDSFEKFDLYERLYVVDYRQTDYFRQIFKILGILGFSWADKLHHVSYGVVKLPEGQMSSRSGTVVSADDVYSRILELELQEVERTMGEKTLETAGKVTLAAFRYGMLKVDPSQDIVFDYSVLTRFDGNTGPYLMYTYARTSSLLEKAGSFNVEKVKEKHPKLEPLEEAILRQIYKFPEEVLKAGANYSPNYIANYLFSLAQQFNSFYAVLPILNVESEEVRNQRLLITKSVGQVLKNGLNLLGIEVVEKM